MLLTNETWTVLIQHMLFQLTLFLELYALISANLTNKLFLFVSTLTMFPKLVSVRKGHKTPFSFVVGTWLLISVCSMFRISVSSKVIFPRKCLITLSTFKSANFLMY